MGCESAPSYRKPYYIIGIIMQAVYRLSAEPVGVISLLLTKGEERLFFFFHYLGRIGTGLLCLDVDLVFRCS